MGPQPAVPAALAAGGQAKKFSPALFVFVLVCFLFPFVTVSCNQQKVMSLSGVQLVFGTTIDQPQMFGPAKPQHVNGEPMAILAFICCLLALGLSFAKNRGGEIAVAALSVIGLVGLFLLRSSLEDQVAKQSSGLLQVNYEPAFWLVVLGNIAAGILNWFAPWRAKGTRPT